MNLFALSMKRFMHASFCLDLMLKPKYVGQSEASVQCLGDFGIKQEIMEEAGPLARALIIMLSANTMMTGLQIEIICRGTDYKVAMIGVAFSGVQFITAEYYKDTLPLVRPCTHPADAMQVKLFAKVPRSKMVFAPSSLMGVLSIFLKGKEASGIQDTTSQSIMS
jgi:hypothetical protein